MAFVFYIVMLGCEGILGERCEIGIGFRFFVAPPPWLYMKVLELLGLLPPGELTRLSSVT